MADRTPYIRWPGVQQPISCQYTLSEGISPGCAILTCLPQDASRIALQGDLILGDGVGEIRLKGCKVARLRSSLDPISGETWTLEILDRRWRWAATGFVHGAYNVPDDTRDTTRPPEGTGPFLAFARIYVPWTVRSPHDLIRQCLDAMGERGYRVDAPNSIYPLPAVLWDFENPAQALSRLCQTLGCRIVYRPDADAVWIVPIGRGSELPDGGPGVLYRSNPSMQAPSRPDSILLVGAPVKYQIEWVLEAVGEEWDDSLKPIEALSYAPPVQLTRHRVDLTPTTIAVSDVLEVTIEYRFQSYLITYESTTTTIADVCTALAASINAAMSGRGFKATATATTVEVLGPANGDGFGVETDVDGVGKLRWDLAVQGANPLSRWAWDDPFQFSLGVSGEDLNNDAGFQQRTNRLTYHEAVAKAMKSVYRYYRIVNVNIETNQPGAFIPQYGMLDPVGGIFRVVLLNEQLDQAVPAATDDQVFFKGGLAVSRDYYNGLFRQKPARCFGSYLQIAAGLLRRLDVNDGLNTENTAEVLVDFALVPERSLVVFSEPVFRYDRTNGFRPGSIRLRCAAHLRDVQTNALVRYTYLHEFPGPKLGTKPAVIRHDDVEYLVRATYSVFTDQNTGDAVLEMNEVLDNRAAALARVQYYTTAAALRYQTPASSERQYNGIMPVFVDGAIQQVTWSISTLAGAETTASRNSEHFIYAPQYPERLRWEYLSSEVKKGDPVPKGRNLMNGQGGGAGHGPAGPGDPRINGPVY